MMLPRDASSATLAGEAMGGVRVRLGSAAIFAMAVWVLAVAYAAIGGTIDLVMLGAAAFVVAASAGVLFVATRAQTERVMLGLGTFYVIATSFAVAAVEQHAGAPAVFPYGISWNALWVALFPLILPCAPSRTLVKALIAATMTPVAYVLFTLIAGRPMLDAWATIGVFAPVYVAAGIAYVGARALGQLGNALSEARSVNRYELIRRIGQGGMGEVWEAQHRMLARPVALKVIKREDEGDTTRVARFQREAQAMARLKSPHTVELFDFGATADGRVFYAMELLEGLDLEALVTLYGPMPPERVAHVIMQALDSLAEAHARGLVHRDVKPANIHLGRHGLAYDHVKVLDFGLVKSITKEIAAGGGLGPTLTADNQISGTPAYMAPEQLLGDGTVDGRADVYALACVAVFLLTGERVFPADDVLRAAVAHVADDPVPPSARGVEVPRELESLIMACLEKDPVRRPDALTLRELLGGLSLEPWTQENARRWWAEHHPFEFRESEVPPAVVERTAPVAMWDA